MKKNILYNLLGLALLVVSLVSCDTASQDVSPIIEPDASYPVATFTTDFTGSTVDEGDTIIYSISINKTIDKSLTFSAQVVGGAADDDDIVVARGTIAPYETETEVMIIFDQDWAADDAETAEIEVGLFGLADKYLVHPTTVNPVFNVTISNYESDILTLVTDWEKDVVINSNETYHPDYTYIEHASSNVDYDMEVYLNDVTYVGGAGTGDCPETIELDVTALANGTYYVYSFLWANYFCDWEIYEDPETVQHTDMPFTSTFSKQGVFGEITVNQDPLEVGNTADFDYYYYGVIDYALVCMFEVTNGIVNVLDYDGTDLGGGKTSSNKTPMHLDKEPLRQ